MELVDTIGAGDAFMSGLIFALAKGELGELLLDDATAGELPEHQVISALETAAASAPVAVSRAGAQPPTINELHQLIVDTV